VNAALPIGVFDSGIGGLTVLRALCERLPQERYLYLGDTARLPYGTKSADTVERYTLQAADELIRRGVKALVIACNTASAAALPALRAAYPDLPLVGVIEPGAVAAVAATRTGRIAVLATEGTVRRGAYQREILKRLPSAQVTAIPATVFVALAEEGWTRGDVAEAAARRYLAPLQEDAAPVPDVLVLGCTHFPPLAATFTKVLGTKIRLVDSAATTAQVLSQLLAAQNLAASDAGDIAEGERAKTCEVRFLVTDIKDRFVRVGPLFLGSDIPPEAVERVVLSSGR
jgi:glutamate racemase